MPNGYVIHGHHDSAFNFTSLISHDSPSKPDDFHPQTGRALKSHRLQNAAAWAWFQHGNGGASASNGTELLLPAAKRKSNRRQQASRFRVEEIMRQSMPINSFIVDEDEGAKIKQPLFSNIDHGQALVLKGDLLEAPDKRRHSFHGPADAELLMFMDAEKLFEGYTNVKPDDMDALSRENGWENCSETSSLLDKLELQMVERQLHQYGGNGWACLHPQEQVFDTLSGQEKSSDNSCTNPLSGEGKRGHSARFHSKNDISSDDDKPLHQHRHHHHQHHGIHHQVGAVVHHLLRSRLKVGAGGVHVPVLCHSVATVNSTFSPHHHHISSTKKTRSSQDTANDLSRRNPRRRRAVYDEAKPHTLHTMQGDDKHSWVATSHVAELYSKVLQPLIHRIRHHHNNGSQEDHHNNNVDDALSEDQEHGHDEKGHVSPISRSLHRTKHGHDEKGHVSPISRSLHRTKHNHYHNHQHIHHHHHHHLHHVAPPLPQDNEALPQILGVDRRALLHHHMEVSGGHINQVIGNRKQQHIELIQDDQFPASQEGFLHEIKHVRRQNRAQCL